MAAPFSLYSEVAGQWRIRWQSKRRAVSFTEVLDFAYELFRCRTAPAAVVTFGPDVPNQLFLYGPDPPSEAPHLCGSERMKSGDVFVPPRKCAPVASAGVPQSP